MTQQSGPAGRRLDRTTWIAFAVTLAVGLAGVGLVIWRIVDSESGSGEAAVPVPVGRINGVVTVGGEPRPGIPVTVQTVGDEGTWEFVATRPSSASGRFVVTGLEPGQTYQVTVAASLPVFAHDFVPLKVGGAGETASAVFGDPVEVDLPVDRGVDGVELDLAPGATLSGRVLSATGEPEADLPVRAYLLTPNGEVSGLYGQAVTDNEGRYTVEGLPPGRFTVSSTDAYGDGLQQRPVGSGTAASNWNMLAHARAAMQDRRSSELPDPVAVETGRGTSLPDLELRRSTVLRGTLRGPDGTPLRDLQVAVKVPLQGTWVSGPSAVTDRRGRFEIPGVLPGRYWLTYESRLVEGSYEWKDSEPFRVKRRDRVIRFDLVTD